MTAFNDFFKAVPWFRTALAWSIAIAAMWLIAAIPGSLVAQLLDRVRLWLSDVLERSGIVKRSRTAERSHQIDEAIEVLRGNRTLAVIAVEAASLFGARVNDALGPLHTSMHQVTSAANGIVDSSRLVQHLLEQLHSTRLNTAGAPPLPECAELVSGIERKRVAWAQVVVGGLLLAACVIVNTGMLSQILRALGIIPTDLSVFGIKLFILLATLITVIEAGVGFVHVILTPAPERNQPARLSLGAVSVLLLAFGIAFVEGFFYSRIGDKTPFVPFAALQMTYEQVFFLWGAFLVLGLFSCGHVFFAGLVTLAKGDSLGALKRWLVKLRQLATSAAVDYQKATQKLRDLQQQCAAVSKEFEGTLAAPGLEKAVNDIGQRLDAAAAEVAGIIAERRDTVSRAEMNQVLVRGRFWIAITALDAAGVIALTARALSPVTRHLGWIGATGAGGALAAALFGMGFALAPGDFVVEQSGKFLRPLSARDAKASRIVGTAIAVMVAFGYATIFWIARRSVTATVTWALSLVFGAGLMIAAYHMAPLLGLFPIYWLGFRLSLLNVVDLLALALLRLSLGLISLLWAIAALIGAPVLVFLRKPPPPAPALKASAV